MRLSQFSGGVLVKNPPPIIQTYDNISVVRDDLIPGGTKARYIDVAFDGVDEVVYATPAEGGAQTALAFSARELSKKLTLVVAARRQQHDRVILSEKLGAKIVEVKPGYLTNVQAKARYYCKGKCNVRNIGFGLSCPGAPEYIADAARLIPEPNELWFAAGSGILAKGLALAWPNVPRFGIQVGYHLTTEDVSGAELIVSPLKFSDIEKRKPPFPADPHYDAKAYYICKERTSGREVTFWNVMGPAMNYYEYV